MSTAVYTGVSRTAVIVAQARALEHDRPDRLFNDPLARQFVDTVGWIQVADAARMNQQHFVLRTRFFDDHLRASGCQQVVLVAAGLDARAFRMDWPPETRLFELDLPSMLDYKQAVTGAHRVRPTCDRRAVAVDLREDWTIPLLDAGFDPRRPTAWLVEGLLMYLTADDGNGVLSRISVMSAPGSTLGLEHVNEAYRQLPEIRVVQRRLVQFGAQWRSTLEDPVAHLAGHGWRAAVTRQVDLADLHGREVPPLTDPRRVGDARMWLITARRGGRSTPRVA